MFNQLNSKLAVVTIARNTFDTQFAQEKADSLAKQLLNSGLSIVGDAQQIFYDANEALAAINILKQNELHALLIIQASFADADATVKMAEAVGNIPIIIWNFREERTGGRLRLNSFCGVNLAAHALSRKNIKIYQIQGEADDAQALQKLKNLSDAAVAIQKLRTSTILVIGQHPVGFDPCDYDPNIVYETFGVQIEKMSNNEFFDLARGIDDNEIAELYEKKTKQLPNISQLEQEAVRKTLKAAKAMENLVKQNGYAGIAVRCWPEFFIDYGAAACGALGIMNEQGIPAGCEADVYGVITAIMLENIAADVVFTTDLVDINENDDTIVFWHCGQAPIQMQNPDIIAQGTIHSNRKMPLLSEFPLKAGEITFARFSRGYNQIKLVAGNANMVTAPLAFSGTAGVAKTQIPASEFMQQIIDIGLEHHTTLAYGNYIEKLKLVAQFLGIDFKKIG